jgi:hypothetical protein
VTSCCGPRTMRSRTYLFILCDSKLSTAPCDTEKSLTLNFRRCLLSRKRKLSELYYATLGATGNSPEADLYRQKEAEFLKANDITEYVPCLRLLFPSMDFCPGISTICKILIFCFFNVLKGVGTTTKTHYHRDRTLRSSSHPTKTLLRSQTNNMLALQRTCRPLRLL